MLKYFRFNNILNSNTLNKSLIKKNIYHQQRIGYYAPERDDYFTEVKDWLIGTNPKLLCVYFTNDWNPICKIGEEGYNNFVTKSKKVVHLKINSDKHPKLRWFFDAKFEPCAKIYYHGALMKTVGGCNFERVDRNINRIYEHVNHTYVPTGDYTKEYEMPYYKWEHDLQFFGNDYEFESTGSFFYHGWRGQFTFREVPDEKLLQHERMKK